MTSTDKPLDPGSNASSGDANATQSAPLAESDAAATSAGDRAQLPIRTDLPTQYVSPGQQEDLSDSFVRHDVSFLPGQVIASRYRVIALLGRGGMGEVYEVEDCDLGDTAALKTILPDTTDYDLMLRRFKREIQLARRITHRNVCRIYDLAYHTESEGEPAYAFVTMELLRGETLADELKKRGRFSQADAIPIIVDLCAGLQAAHELGIVHRDFKSANVMLVDGNGSSRAVVTDFGLARIAEGDGGGSLTRTGVVLGTPAYIAPEQIHDPDVGPAADIYALGVVMFEMLTGRVPFTGKSAASTIVKRLTEDPPAPRSFVGSIDPRVEAVILRCLRRQPSDRFASAADVATALSDIATSTVTQEDIATSFTPAEGLAAATTEPEVSRFPGTPTQPEVSFHHSEAGRRWIGAATLLAIGMVLAGWWYWRSTETREQGPPARPTAAAEIPARPSIAILGFRNASEDTRHAWMSTALGELLAAELTSDKVRIVPGESVSRVRADLTIPDSESFSTDTLRRLRSNLGSDYVVVGSYVVIGSDGDRIRYNVRIQNTATGETLATFIEEAPAGEITLAASTFGERLRRQLGLPDVSATMESAIRAAAPANAEALRLYSEGLGRLRSSDFSGARDLLEQALKQDPNFAVAHSTLSEVWNALGYDTRAAESAKSAFDLSVNLPRASRLGIEARYRESAGAWQKAVDNYKLLLDFAPDDVDIGIRLAAAQIELGRPKEARGTLAHLRRLPSPLRDDSRIDLTEADALNALADNRGAIKAADRAIATGTLSGARSLTARASFKKGLNEAALGQTAAARASFAGAQALYHQVGDLRGEAIVLGQTADLLKRQGDVEAAERALGQALQINDRIGDVRNQSNDLNDLANIYLETGRLPDARAAFERSLALTRRSGNRRAEATTLLNFAMLFEAQGDLAAARNAYTSALKASEEVADRGLTANALGALGNLLYHGQGDDSGIDYLERALTAARDSRRLPTVLRALNDVATVRLNQGRLSDAIAGYQESLTISREIGDSQGEATALSNLAAAQLEAGQAVAAAPLFADAVRRWRAIGDTFLLSYSLADQSLLLIAQNDLTGAEKALVESIAIRKDLQDSVAAASGSVRLASVAAEKGDTARAEQLARPALETLEETSQFDDAIIGRVTLARAALAAGDTAAARREAKAAADLSTRSRAWASRKAAETMGAYVDARGGNAAALAQLSARADEAAARGYVRLALEFRLLYAEAAIGAGRRDAARAAARQIATDAEKRGLVRIAARARQLAS